ncbi:MAG TPA: DJ-1/PfpI family protein [Streptosporangiaceae bacterium]|nr:DJ-1/PfpI family protein [Streptosporangiaceae bacterium]
MDVAIMLYENFTALDAIGPYEVLSRLPGSRVTFVAQRPGPVAADTGMLTVQAEAALGDLPRPDIVLVPGGPGQAPPTDSEPVLDWLRAADPAATWMTSVCTGSLVLAAAGLLAGRRATSHWLSLETLAEYQAEPVMQRVVTDGKYITCAGVSAGIDMALELAGRIAGTATAQSIQLMIEYDPQPPFDAGSPRTAPAEVVERMRIRSRRAAAQSQAR